MHKKQPMRLLVVMAALAGLAGVAGSHAQSEPQDAQTPREYSDRGADTCLRCHDEDSEFPVLPIFATRHAQPADGRTPFAGLQCEACHGPVGEHGKRKLRDGEIRQPMLYFGASRPDDPAAENGICLDCHTRGARIGWHGSAHEGADVACANCHRIHVTADPVLARTKQDDVCYACHRRARADFHKPSAHPVRFGHLACSDCHDPHGAMTDDLLARPTLNQTCYACHADKRGPFLWEHAPVAEDCALCHAPHGSVHPALLVRRPPLLCQQCHSQRGHPSVPHGPAGVVGGGGSPSAFLLGAACLNCHSQVHGSNHPSGVKLMR